MPDAGGVISGEQTAAVPAQAALAAKIDVRGMNFYYGATRTLDGITLRFQPNQVAARSGPTACGKWG
jgi:phosphate transport system ATP-binding protein